tara:strand:+ start:1829 stop:2440 length:612 start_codon:yes stop_codon:yes gene_type:complete
MFNARSLRQISGTSSQLLETIIQNVIHDSINEQQEGISDDMLQQLRNSAVNNESGQCQCSICLDNINIGESFVTLQCSHKFHLHCIERWCQSHNTCPMCRNVIEQPSLQQSDQQRTQRIIVNNISTVQISILYEGNTNITWWYSCDTIVDIFTHLRRQYETNTRLMLQFGNKIFKTTESYELLAHTLSQHGIIGQVNANLYQC